MKGSLTVLRPATLIGLLLMTLGIILASSVAAGPTAEQAAPQQEVRLYLPVALTGRPTKWSPDSIFGVQMYNDSRPNSHYYNSLIGSGATWLRTAMHWHLVEPTDTTPDAFNWAYSDASFGAGRVGASGMKLIGTIESAPAWALVAVDKPDGPLRPEALTDFAEFVAATVERYDGDGLQDAPGSPVVDYWEFYNEPDRRLNTSDGRWGLHGAEYAQMLATVYPIVKNQNPDAQVLLGGLAYDWFTEQGGPFNRAFLDDVLAAGGGAYFDIFNFHGYPIFAYNWLPPGTTAPGSGLLEKAIYLRDKLTAMGIDKPFFVTEAGWHSNNPSNVPSSEEAQARYVVELYVQSLAADIDAMIWWMLFDPGGGGWDNGLVSMENPPRQKLSFTAHQTIVNMLTGLEFTRTLTRAEIGNSAVEAYQFTDPADGRTLYVAWMNPVAAGGSTTLTLAAEQAQVVNIYGQATASLLDSDDGADDGHVQVTITGQPAYIEVGQ